MLKPPRQSTSKPTTSAASQSVPSLRSQPASSATVSTESAAQPNSVIAAGDGSVPELSGTVPVLDGSTATHGGDWPHDFGGAHSSSAAAALPSTPPEPPGTSTKSDSPRIIARMASGESEGSRLDTRDSDSHIRQSRSRSRLRGLKFWKKRRDVSGIDGASPDSASP